MSCKWLSGQLISSEPEVLITINLTSVLSDKGFPYGLPYQTEVRRLSQGVVLKCGV